MKIAAAENSKMKTKVSPVPQSPKISTRHKRKEDTQTYLLDLL